MVQSTANLSIITADGISGNTPFTKVISGLVYQGLLSEYVQQQQIGLSSPMNLGASVSATGFLPAGTYYYKVTALNGTGETVGSSEASATISNATGSVMLVWNAVSGASSYRVYRGTVSGAQSVYYACSTNSYTDTGAWATSGSVPGSNTTQVSAPGTVTPTGSTTGGTLAANTYYYKVTAVNGAGETTPSPEANVTTTGSTGSVGLAWSAVTGADSYRIYRGTTSNGESVYFTSSTNSFTDTGAAGTSGTVPGSNTTQVSAPSTITPAASTTGGSLPAGTYFYKVTAVNAVGETTGSSEASATTIGNASSVALAWPAVAGAKAYNVYRGTTTGSENKVVQVSGNSFTDTTAPAASASAPTSNTTGTSWTPTLPATPVQFVFLRNLSATNTATVSWTPTGGSSNPVQTLAPNGMLLSVQPSAVAGGGITALSISVSAPGTPIEAIFTS